MVVDNQVRVFTLASTRIYEPGVVGWLEYLIKEHASDPAVRADAVKLAVDYIKDRRRDDVSDGAILIELAGRRCYRSFLEGLNINLTKIRESNQAYIENVVKQRHGSVFAHATITFGLENVSRIFTHEMVRNSIGNAFSQESMRYVRAGTYKIRVPKIVSDYTHEIILRLGELERLIDVRTNDAIGQSTDFNWKKKVTSAMRRFLPAVNTGMVVTLNWRSLRWLLEQRSEPGVEEEFREVIGLIVKEVRMHTPEILTRSLEGVDEEGTWIKFLESKI
jgi:thymidylate synthase (FAD)